MATPIVQIKSNYNPTYTTINPGLVYQTFGNPSGTYDTLTISLVNTSGNLSSWTLSLVGFDDRSQVSDFTLTQATLPTLQATIQLPSHTCSAIFESRINNDPTQRYRFKVQYSTNTIQIQSFSEIYESSTTTGNLSIINQQAQLYGTQATDLITTGSDCIMNWNTAALSAVSTNYTIPDKKGVANLALSYTPPGILQFSKFKPMPCVNITSQTNSFPVFQAAYSTSNAYETYSAIVEYNSSFTLDSILFGRYLSGSSGAFWGLGVNATTNCYQISYLSTGLVQSIFTIPYEIPRRPHQVSFSIDYTSQIITTYIDGKAVYVNIVSSYTTPPTGRIFIGVQSSDIYHIATLKVFDFRYHNAIKNSTSYLQILAETIL
jgi:hypothetical protein